MRCKQMRHLIIDATEQEPAREESQDMERHLARCDRCARFRESLEAVRIGVRDLPHPAPSGSVDARVRALIGNAGSILREPAQPLPARGGSFSIPRTIWAAIPVLVILTSIIMTSGLKELLDKTGSLLAATFIALLIQNTAMLVFAPILIRALRQKAALSGWNQGDAHAS